MKNNVYSRAVEYALDLDNGEAVFQREHSLHNAYNRVASVGGQVAPLDNGDWLVSWGSGSWDNDPGTPLPPDHSATQVDPDTHEEKFSFQMFDVTGVEPPANVARTRAIPITPVALAARVIPLAAEIADSASNSTLHLGTSDKPKVVVAFNQPVVDPDSAATAWPWVNVRGATVESVSPHTAPGEAANAYIFTLAPTGGAAITFGLVTGVSCASGGICTTGGAALTEVPASSHAIPPPPPPVVTLALTSGSIGENGGVSMVTASLDHASSEVTTVAVSVQALGEAEAGGFSLSGGTLTIAAGATASSGTVTVTAVNNDVDAPNKEVRVSGGGQQHAGGGGEPIRSDADHHRRRCAAGGDLIAVAGLDWRERRGEQGDGEPGSSFERDNDGDGVCAGAG